MEKVRFSILAIILILLKISNGSRFGTEQILWTCVGWLFISYIISSRKRIADFISVQCGREEGKKRIFNFAKQSEAKENSGLTDVDRIDMNHAWMRINERLKAVYHAS